jgi:adenylate kinase
MLCYSYTEAKMLKKLVFLGAPGAGKGTIAGRAQNELGFKHISTGDIFRYHIKNETELGKQIKALTASGKLVDDNLTNALVKETLGTILPSQAYILDGYPRTLPQADYMANIVKLDAVINFVIDEKLLHERLGGRLVCRKCGKLYHRTNMPPSVAGQCDSCGGEIYQRADDSDESIVTRLAEYHRLTAPLIDYYSPKGLVRTIEAGHDSETVWLNFKKIVQ